MRPPEQPDDDQRSAPMRRADTANGEREADARGEDDEQEDPA